MNRFFSFLGGWFGRGGATGDQTGVQQSVPATSVHSNPASFTVDGALQVSTVWACVDLLTKTIASLPLFTYVKQPDGQKKLDRESRLSVLLHDSPNANQTPMEFWVAMLLNLFLRGNAYAALDRAPNGEVVSMWPLAADQMQVSVDAQGSYLYAYHTEKGVQVFTDADVLHIKGLGNGRVGLSRLDLMRASVGLAVSATNYQNDIFKNSGKRGGILMLPAALTPEQRAMVRKNFSELAEGTSSPLYILESSATFEPLGMTPADTQLLETRRFAVEDLCRWMGVPSIMVNDKIGTTMWGTGVEQILEGFYKLTLGPELKRIEQAITKRVMTPKQRAMHTVEFNFEGLLRTNLASRMQAYKEAVQNGLKTRNECRQLENDPPIDGADVLTVQMQMIPLNSAGQNGNIVDNIAS
ncbi:MAG: phage portal protein [Shewanella sp.]